MSDACESDTTAWLIEECWIGPKVGGHYIHRDFNERRWHEECRALRQSPYIQDSTEPFITKDYNMAMRFATEADAWAWIKAQSRMISRDDQFQPREHMWCPSSPLPLSDKGLGDK